MLLLHDVFPKIDAKEEVKAVHELSSHDEEKQLQSVSTAPSISEILLIFRRRKVLIAILTCLGTAAAAFLASQFDPQYTAEASVVIEGSTGAPIKGMTTVDSTLYPDPETMATQVNLMRRPPFLGRIIERLDLVNHPTFAQTETGWLSAEGVNMVVSAASEMFQVAASQIEGQPLENVDQTPLLPTHTSIIDEVSVAKSISKRFVVAQVGDSQVINIAFTSPSPQLSADVVNTAASTYVEGQLESKLEKVSKMESWTANRLEQLKDEVRRTEEAIENYRAEYGLTTAVSGEAHQVELIELNRDLTVARGQLTDLESKLALLKDLEDKEEKAAREAITSIVSSPLMVQLQSQQLELERAHGELAET